jgi:nucleoside-diphosphate-sugar epimerase
VLCDVFDARALARAIAEAAPDAVVNQLTDLPQTPRLRGMKAAYAANNRARGEGGRNLLAATRAAGVTRYVTQSVAFFCRPAGRPGLRDEDTPLWTDAPGMVGEAVRVVAATETEAVAAGGVVLRYGFFAGPGTWYHPDSAIARLVRKRRFPIIGAGDGVHSFVHVDDAAAATVAALEAPAGIYNVVDDDPAPTREWLPAFAAALGAPRPRRVPRTLVRLAGGGALAAWQESLEGAGNERAKSVLGWAPGRPTWRTGFRDP